MPRAPPPEVYAYGIYYNQIAEIWCQSEEVILSRQFPPQDVYALATKSTMSPVLATSGV